MALITVVAGAVAAKRFRWEVSPRRPPPGSPRGLAGDAPSLYERWSDRLVDWCPYVTLALSAVLTLAWSNDPAGERLVTAGLVALAALWVFLGYTRAPRPRQAHRARMLVYFIGLLAIATVLAMREYLFFIFLITGFFHATVLRPWPLLIVGVFATSVLVNTVIGGFPTNPEWWTI